jgi:hypothetical protein
MKLTTSNMERNREDMVDFARQTGNEFYTASLAAYDTAQEVFEMALAERDAAFHRLAMQIKLADADQYIKVGLDWEEMDTMDGGEKIQHLISKGKFRLGHTYACNVGSEWESRHRRV